MQLNFLSSKKLRICVHYIPCSYYYRYIHNYSGYMHKSEGIALVQGDTHTSMHLELWPVVPCVNWSCKSTKGYIMTRLQEEMLVLQDAYIRTKISPQVPVIVHGHPLSWDSPVQFQSLQIAVSISFALQ